MHWQVRLVTVWCGISTLNVLACLAPEVAVSQVEAPASSQYESSSVQYTQTSVNLAPEVVVSQVEAPVSSQQESSSVQYAQTPVNPPPAGSSDRNEDRFLQTAPLPAPTVPQEQTPVLPTPAPAPTPETPPPTSTTQIRVQRIDVVGSTIFKPEEFAPITQPVIGQAVTLEQLRMVADRITQLYLDGGYITSRAVLVDQVISEGVVQIRVIEGSLERIDIEGNHRVNADYIRSRVQLGGRIPLNQGSLEDQLRLLRLDPLFENVEASLRAGSGLGQSILTVRVTESNPVAATFSTDNYSPPSVGSEQFGVANRDRKSVV